MQRRDAHHVERVDGSLDASRLRRDPAKVDGAGRAADNLRAKGSGHDGTGRREGVILPLPVLLDELRQLVVVLLDHQRRHQSRRYEGGRLVRRDVQRNGDNVASLDIRVTTIESVHAKERGQSGIVIPFLRWVGSAALLTAGAMLQWFLARPK